MKEYKQISDEERVKISAWLELGLCQSEIALRLGKHRSSISRELTRNTFRYDGSVKTWKAKHQIRERRKQKSLLQRKLVKDSRLRAGVVRLLKKYYSPEQICGRLKKIRGNSDPDFCLCPETIYRFVYEQRPELRTYLRQQKGKYRRRYRSLQRIEERKKLLNNRRIDKRPAIVETRQRIGDWEGDTVVGKNRSGYIVTMVDRKTGYLVAKTTRTKEANKVRKAIEESFEDIPSRYKQTTTFDNGTEFMEYEQLEQATGLDVYFAYPYHSWERGTNENTNGLLRQFFPKTRDFSNITQTELDHAVSLLNNRPRKRLNFRSPAELFHSCCTWD